MPRFIMAYQGSPGEDAGKEGMEAWEKWAETNSTALVERGSTFGKSKTVTSGGVADGAGVNTAALAGYSILECADINAAAAIARTNPFVTGGGQIEVAELMDMAP